jgi:hypothetical protein
VIEEVGAEGMEEGEEKRVLISRQLWVLFFSWKKIGNKNQFYEGNDSTI